MTKERTQLMIKQILENPNIDNKYIERELAFLEKEVRHNAIKEERKRVNKLLKEREKEVLKFHNWRNAWDKTIRDWIKSEYKYIKKLLERE